MSWAVHNSLSKLLEVQLFLLFTVNCSRLQSRIISLVYLRPVIGVLHPCNIVADIRMGFDLLHNGYPWLWWLHSAAPMRYQASSIIIWHFTLTLSQPSHPHLPPPSLSYLGWSAIQPSSSILSNFPSRLTRSVVAELVEHWSRVWEIMGSNTGGVKPMA